MRIALEVSRALLAPGVSTTLLSCGKPLTDGLDARSRKPGTSPALGRCSRACRL